MDCTDVQKLIQDYVDGLLTRRDTNAVDRHVSGCPGCADELRLFRSLVVALGDIPREPVPAGFTDRAMARLREAGRISDRTMVVESLRRRVFSRVPPRLRAPVTAALAVVLVVALFPAVIQPLGGIAGKTAVVATDAYFTADDALGEVAVLGQLVDGVEANLRTVLTILQAAFSLLAAAGETYMMPAIGSILMLTLGFAWFLRSTHRRSSHNATLSF